MLASGYTCACLRARRSPRGQELICLHDHQLLCQRRLASLGVPASRDVWLAFLQTVLHPESGLLAGLPACLCECLRAGLHACLTLPQAGRSSGKALWRQAHKTAGLPADAQAGARAGRRTCPRAGRRVCLSACPESCLWAGLLGCRSWADLLACLPAPLLASWHACLSACCRACRAQLLAGLPARMNVCVRTCLSACGQTVLPACQSAVWRLALWRPATRPLASGRAFARQASNEAGRQALRAGSCACLSCKPARKQAGSTACTLAHEPAVPGDARPGRAGRQYSAGRQASKQKDREEGSHVSRKAGRQAGWFTGRGRQAGKPDTREGLTSSQQRAGRGRQAGLA